MQPIARRILARAGASCALAVLALGTACTASTTGTGIWKSPAYAQGPMKNVVVVGGRMSGAERHQLEDGYVAALANRGVRATPSYRLFPDSEVQAQLDPAAMGSTLRSDGFDGVLVSTLRQISQQVRTEPGAEWSQAPPGSFWGAQAPMPTVVRVEPTVDVQTTVWSTGSGKMVWSQSTRTQNPMSRDDFVASLTKAVVPSLEGSGMITPGT
jgi:hypothetical protein